MPSVIYCQSDDGEPAVFLITNLENGETLSPCAAHAGDVFLTLAQAFLGVPDQEPADGAHVNGAAPSEAEAVPDTARPKRRRAARETGQEALASEASPFSDVTPDDS